MPQDFNENAFKTVIAEALQINSKDVQGNLSLGSIETWDSLNHFNLIFAIEEAFGVRFDSEEIPNLKTISLLQKAILKHLGKS